jgi:hypothetical protein
MQGSDDPCVHSFLANCCIGFTGLTLSNMIPSILVNIFAGMLRSNQGCHNWTKFDTTYGSQVYLVVMRKLSALVNSTSAVYLCPA